MPDFLLEIGLEEIPARMIQDAERDLGRISSFLLAKRLIVPDQEQREQFEDAAGVRGKLVTQDLMVISGHSASSTDRSSIFSTPRRLAFFYPNVLAVQPDV